MNRNSTKEFNAFDYIIQITSEENTYMVQSSDKYNWYMVILTGPNAAVCSCPAFAHGYQCKHRKSVQIRFPYVTPDDTELDEFTLARIKRAEREYRAREVARFQSSDLPPAA